MLKKKWTCDNHGKSYGANPNELLHMFDRGKKLDVYYRQSFVNTIAGAEIYQLLDSGFCPFCEDVVNFHRWTVGSGREMVDVVLVDPEPDYDATFHVYPLTVLEDEYMDVISTSDGELFIKTLLENNDDPTLLFGRRWEFGGYMMVEEVGESTNTYHIWTMDSCDLDDPRGSFWSVELDNESDDVVEETSSHMVEILENEDLNALEDILQPLTPTRI